MTPQTKRALRYGGRSLARVVATIIKVFGTAVLVFATAGVLLALIGALYVSKNLNTNLDIDLYSFTLKQTSTIYYMDKSGEPVKLETLQAQENRELAIFEELPKQMIDALIAVEDKRFFSHKGVDWWRTVGAFTALFSSNQDQYGGSTITQQLIKNLTGNKEVTVKRKLTEIFVALECEKHYTKQEILTLYLNTCYFGQGSYGVKVAARTYFGKELNELTLAECASIIGITNSPNKYDPFRNPGNNKKRQEEILKKMLDQELITDADYRRAMVQPMEFTHDNKPSERGTQTWFVDQVYRDVVADLVEQKGYTKVVAQQLVLNGGLDIYCTMDPEIQAIMDEIFINEENIPKVRGLEKPQAAMILMDPYTGCVLGMAGGVGEKQGSLNFNRATMAARQPGSSIKPIAVYAPAMEYGFITPYSVIDDSPFRSEKGNPWPRNSGGRYKGRTIVYNAVTNSVNTVAARVIDMISPERAHQFLVENMGITTLNDNDYSWSLGLGGLNKGLSVLEITAAYCAFDNHGEYIKPRTYTKVSRIKASGEEEEVLNNLPQKHAAIEEKNAWYMNTMLQNVVKSGTGARAKLDVDMPAAGKTGTTTEDKDRWFVGYTPYYCAGVWFGFDDPKKISLEQSTNPALALWKMVMDRVHEGLERREFFEIDSDDVVQASYCLDSGMRPTDKCRADPRGARIATGYYYKGDAPKDLCEVHVLVDRDRETGGLATPYCPAENIQKIAMLNLTRAMPTSGVYVEDEAYRIRYYEEGGGSTAGSVPEGFYQPSTPESSANSFCPLHEDANWEQELPPDPLEQPDNPDQPGNGTTDQPDNTHPPDQTTLPPDGPEGGDAPLEPLSPIQQQAALTPLPDLTDLLPPAIRSP